MSRNEEVRNMAGVMIEEDERVLAETGPEEFGCETDFAYWDLVREAHLLAAKKAEEKAIG